LHIAVLPFTGVFKNVSSVMRGGAVLLTYWATTSDFGKSEFTRKIKRKSGFQSAFRIVLI
jgi:hypothetical protein